MAATFSEWVTWPDREIVAVAVFQPNLRLKGWTSVGGATPHVYSIALARFAFTDLIFGGIYQRCVGLHENTTALTAAASLAACEVAASSWYWDEANGILYAHSSTGSDPDLFTVYFAQVEIRCASRGIVLQLTDGAPSTAVHHPAWLMSEAPSSSFSFEDLFFGLKMTATSQLPVINDSYVWYRLAANDSDYWWKNAPVTFYQGGSYNHQDLPWSQYAGVLSMEVENLACTDEVCTFEVKPIVRALNLQIPPTPIFESEYAHLGDGVRGTKKAILYGRVTFAPDLVDTSADGLYLLADPEYQTLFAVYTVTARNKATGVRTTLSETTDYLADLTLCTVEIVNPTYTWQAYTIEVDAAGKPNGDASDYLKRVGEITQDWLTTFVGIDLARINADAFDQADLDAPDELAIYLKSPREISSLLAGNLDGYPTICGSVFATLSQTLTGLWTILVWTPQVPDDVVRLSREDFELFVPQPQIAKVPAVTYVHYAQNVATGAWATESASDAAVAALVNTRDEINRYTFLRSAVDAATLATRSMLLSGGRSLEIEFRERGSLLAQAMAGDKVLITRDPAMSAAGKFTLKPFEIIRIDRGGTNLLVAGRFSDLRGVGAIVGHWKDDSDAAWSALTSDERSAQPGFWCDDNGRADAADPASEGVSIYW